MHKEFFINLLDNFAHYFVKFAFFVFFIDSLFWREMVHPAEVSRILNVIHDFFENISIVLYPQLEDIFYLSYDQEKDVINNDNNLSNKSVIKFEEKYLDKVRNMSKAYPFTDLQKEQINIATREFYRAISDQYLKEIDQLRNEINNLKLEINDIEEYDDLNHDTSSASKEEYDPYNEKRFSSRKEECFFEIERNTAKIKALEIKHNDAENIQIEAAERAEKTILDTILDEFKNSFVMEHTPLGNVIMFYNNKKGSFEYYSDNTIPYRYLETVARKYVKIHNCRAIYFDMEEELKNYETKLIEKEAQEKEQSENQIVRPDKQIQDIKPKKSVFARFKDYNKEGLSGKVNTAPPPKNSIPSKNVTDNVNKQRVLLKENANRYTFEGKISNFNILQKIPRKMVDKKYAMTFADFKKNVLNK